MPPSHKKNHRTTIHHKTKTHVVTNTQLVLAVAAAFLAGGLAYVVSPHRTESSENSCRLGSIDFVERCNGSNFRGAEFTCSNGLKGEIPVSRYCRNTKKLRRMATEICGEQQCVPVRNEKDEESVESIAEAPKTELPVETPVDVINPNACEVGAVRFLDRCGHNQYQKVEVTCSNGSLLLPSVSCQSVDKLQEFATLYCASLDCSPRKNLPVSNVDTTHDTTNPIPFDTTQVRNPVDVSTKPVSESSSKVSVPLESRLQIEGSPTVKISGGKLSFEMTLLNKGNGDAPENAQYTLVFIDEKGNALSKNTLTLASVLKANERSDFGTTLPLVPHAAFLRVFIEPAYADTHRYDLTVPMPVEASLPVRSAP